MDTLIIQDTFEPYYAGRDHDAPEKPNKAKRWLASRGQDNKADDKTSRDKPAGA